MVTFKHISENSKQGPVRVYTGEMCEYGDLVELDSEHLIEKARNNPNYEEVKEGVKQPEALKDVDKSDDGEEIRELAKSKGIKNVGNKAIKTLLKEIEELEKPSSKD